VVGEQRPGQGDQPGYRGEQQQTHQHRQQQANHPRAIALGRRELFRQDRDKNEVINTENQLYNHQRYETGPN
jgi:hypothetical protein